MSEWVLFIAGAVLLAVFLTVAAFGWLVRATSRRPGDGDDD